MRRTAEKHLAFLFFCLLEMLSGSSSGPAYFYFISYFTSCVLGVGLEKWNRYGGMQMWETNREETGVSKQINSRANRTEFGQNRRPP